MENPNPIIVPTVAFRVKEEDRRVFGESDYEPIDALEVFDIVRDINDPEHPLTLEQLRVVHPDLIKVQDSTVILTFTPTIPHCSMATLIGLCLRIKLMRSLPRRFKIDVSITPGTHNSEEQSNIVQILESDFIQSTSNYETRNEFLQRLRTSIY